MKQSWDPVKREKSQPAADDMDTIRRRLKEIQREEGRDDPVGDGTEAWPPASPGMYGEILDGA